jgi:dihydrofolate synthase / folylpolyglutamate synthase
MSYAAAIDQLNSLVPELHTRPGQQRRKFSLDQMRILLAALGDPQMSFSSVLIAGTNGKGSTASTLASILIAGGLRTGLYTSPHLTRVNERICVDRNEIPDEAFAILFFRVRETALRLVENGRLPQPPSFFEILTAIAFLHFADVGIEIAVLEVGMGGRLDATNVVTPLLSVITDISLDHMEWLGGTIAAIAREKAGILRPGGTLVTLPQQPKVNQVLGEVATGMAARFADATPYLPAPGSQATGRYQVSALGKPLLVDSPLIGSHQQRNLALAIAAAVELAQTHRISIQASTIEAGIHQTEWPGRLEHLKKHGVEWILDVAHNPAGASALHDGLVALFKEHQAGLRRTLIFSCLRDKPAAEMVRILFPVFDRVILAPIHSPRATPLAELLAVAQSAATPAVAAQSIAEALQLAEQETQGGVVVICGSVYLVGEARPLLTASGV